MSQAPTAEQQQGQGVPGANPDLQQGAPADPAEHAATADPVQQATPEAEAQDAQPQHDWPQELVDIISKKMGRSEKEAFLAEIPKYSFTAIRGESPENYGYILKSLSRLNKHSDRLGITGANLLAEAPWALAMIAGQLHSGSYAGDRTATIGDSGVTPLHLACLLGDVELIDFFTGNESPIYVWEETNPSASEERDQYSVVEYINPAINSRREKGERGYNHRIDINTTDKNGFSPVHWYALSRGYTRHHDNQHMPSVLAHLMDNISYTVQVKADPQEGDQQVQFVAEERKMAGDIFLKSKGSNSDTKGKSAVGPCTPIQLACEVGNTSMLDECYNHESHINLKNSKYDNGEGTFVTWIALHGNKAGMKHCLDGEARFLKSINTPIGSNGETAAHLAAKTGNMKVLKFLQARGANLLAETSKGWTPLHVCAHAGNEEATKFIVGKLYEQHENASKLGELDALLGKVRAICAKNIDLKIEQKQAKREAEEVPDKYIVGDQKNFKDICNSVVKVLKAYRRKVEPSGRSFSKKAKAKIKSVARYAFHPNHHFGQANRDLIKKVEDLRDNEEKSAEDRANDLLALVSEARDARNAQVRSHENWDRDGDYNKALGRAKTLAKTHIELLHAAQYEEAKPDAPAPGVTGSQGSTN